LVPPLAIAGLLASLSRDSYRDWYESYWAREDEDA
jgi:hypothetical protein